MLPVTESCQCQVFHSYTDAESLIERHRGGQAPHGLRQSVANFIGYREINRLPQWRYTEHCRAWLRADFHRV